MFKRARLDKKATHTSTLDLDLAISNLVPSACIPARSAYDLSVDNLVASTCNLSIDNLSSLGCGACACTYGIA